MDITIKNDKAQYITDKLGISHERADKLKEIVKKAVKTGDVVDGFKVITSEVTDSNELAVAFMWTGQAIHQVTEAMDNHPLVQMLKALSEE